MLLASAKHTAQQHPLDESSQATSIDYMHLPR